MTANDGPISVSRAFTAADWGRILTAAGVQDRATIEWFFPFRYTVANRK
jgi:hypothetical protein